MVNNRQDVPPAGDASVESESVEFTKEEVEALLNEKPKAKKFDHKVIFLIFMFSVGFADCVLDLASDVGEI